MTVTTVSAPFRSRNGMGLPLAAPATPPAEIAAQAQLWVPAGSRHSRPEGRHAVPEATPVVTPPVATPYTPPVVTPFPAAPVDAKAATLEYLAVIQAALAPEVFERIWAGKSWDATQVVTPAAPVPAAAQQDWPSKTWAMDEPVNRWVAPPVATPAPAAAKPVLSSDIGWADKMWAGSTPPIIPPARSSAPKHRAPVEAPKPKSTRLERKLQRVEARIQKATLKDLEHQLSKVDSSDKAVLKSVEKRAEAERALKAATARTAVQAEQFPISTQGVAAAAGTAAQVEQLPISTPVALLGHPNVRTAYRAAYRAAYREERRNAADFRAWKSDRLEFRAWQASRTPAV